MAVIWTLIWFGIALIVAAIFGSIANHASRDKDPATRIVSRIRKAGF